MLLTQLPPTPLQIEDSGKYGVASNMSAKVVIDWRKTKGEVEVT